MDNPSHLHILGIGGTFMGGLAQLAKAMGYVVTGSDQALYPPMSTQLAQAGIDVTDYGQDPLANAPDQIVIGNALSRGHPAVETVLNAQQRYTSGPQWLSDHLLQDRWVVAVAGTHGKTTTSAMVAWILEYAGLNPGFLIGGVPENFGVSARLGASPFFVMEADEYDTAFFDKRSKFVHYRPRTCVLNNLEFDHGDIFADLAAIQTQFHHLVRTVPGNGLVIAPQADAALDGVLAQGCWSELKRFSQGEGVANSGHEAGWTYQPLREDGGHFAISLDGERLGEVAWPLTGHHNMQNAVAAVIAAQNCGVSAKLAVTALNHFEGVKRRLTNLGEVNGIRVYDDFAHHPTAIKSTLEGLRARMQREQQSGRLIAVFEPRSNTMRLGMHRQRLPQAFDAADQVFAFIDPDWGWQLPVEAFRPTVSVNESYDALLAALKAQLQPGDQVVLMSNGGFGGLPQKLLTELER
ncbi:UDP-N-acetylmuramate:L-alanyl-gamma-D-glutamyl-meso-diaminopimelate ligase [Thiomicrospira sp. WB1]|uniref:UDP-N-acetylmuramate:L-alanyl-gamma-D-glutamyl- meso-diaminopimelate ligase n=1 Tax=Thiomicrospira sp. WB1 TaxID=1685380 RepID=UPI000749DFC2|nr:UDP-N-acetylmuramate:L-alanyl-gamma-D-glutamyl-meso-diaminopimelate ligase [Thiomicrospira sp. WB1]KUJ72971.1 UDP-N-acetylmuramate:L-alanyl-gamma-D-glutamyl-meso-diaminopimelate ligase [Thiomicrospira sp. WB1]